jgi:hypothetical protein
MDNNKITANLFELYKAIAKISATHEGTIGEFEYVHNFNSAWPNMIFNSSLDYTITNTTVKKFKDEIKKNDLPKTLVVDESIVTNDVLHLLRQIGFMPVTQWTNMTAPIFVNPDKKISKELDIKVIGSNDSTRLSEWVSIVKQVLFPKENLDADIFKFGIDNNIFKLFIGYYDKIPAVTSLLYLSTLQEFRKKGLAKTMLNEVHSFASTVGYKNTILHSTNYGLKLYQSLGYEERGKMILFYSL